MLNIDEVKKIANLARLHLTDEEVELYRGQLSSILDYVGQLKEVDTSNVEPTSQVTGLTDVTREDRVELANVDEHQRILNQFPQHEGNLLKVKAVFE
ncbi:Asp-tRNA(Asn)/Glu-tRNA(Gln) amidotransferase subunit GatC [Candidatus Uhrbacteria bacterium]|nr:Asp-tRNA(Asn)/Glu-tRNA(Gln) amidotransferase subunit GatC [Candidatus Uhrbacteria bacterium]